MKPEPKIDQFKRWIRSKGIISSNDAREWGHKNYLGSARTRCQEMAQRGILRKLSDDEIEEMKLNKKGRVKVAWWTWC
jgi:hypothetical protein